MTAAVPSHAILGGKWQISAGNQAAPLPFIEGNNPPIL
jgi:hypothetical protein